MEEKEVMLGVPDDMNEVNIYEHRAMVYLPDDAVEVEIKAKVFHDGGLLNVSKRLSMKDLREAFRKADEGYIDEDDMFTLTDKGKSYLDSFYEDD